jgi:N-carbamoylputrescine amidase
MKIAVVEWRDGLEPDGAEWQSITEALCQSSPDLLVTNEMPFGDWLPVQENYDAKAATAWIELHERGLQALTRLRLKAIVSSRPVQGMNRLYNEAFSLEAGEYRRLHRKHYLPNEAGWYEAKWFCPDVDGFRIHTVAGIKLGCMLCTDLMFNEHARLLGRQGAHLIVVPRATGQNRLNWETAARMAALAGRCYVASSNRVGASKSAAPEFGGHGFVVSPVDLAIESTDAAHQILSVSIDPKIADQERLNYPGNVEDIAIRGVSKNVRFCSRFANNRPCGDEGA